MHTPFLREIEEMPDALRALVDAWGTDGGAQAAAWRGALAGAGRVVALGSGTSSFALGTLAAGLARRGVAFHVDDAGEWLHAGSVLAAGEFAVLCSQSGASAEIVRLLERGLAARACAVTNDPGSPLARACVPMFALHAGAETAISTKTYANTLALGHLLGAATCGDVEPCLRRLRAVAAALERAPATAPDVAVAALQGVAGVAVIGRTHAAPAVRQLALTLAEGAGLWAAPFVGGSFRHGPLEACGPRNGVVAFAADDSAGALVVRLCAEARALGSPVVLFTDRADAPGGCVVLPVPGGADAEDISLRASVAQARFVHALAAARGLEAGVFRVNSKVTRIE